MDPKRLIEPKREEDPPLPPRTRQLADLVNALSEVTVMDGHANWGVLSQTAEMLMGAYTVNQILLYYGRGQPENGHWNWYLHDWRGLRNEPPAPSQILATIKRAAQGMIPQPPTAKEQPAGKMVAADSYAEVFGT